MTPFADIPQGHFGAILADPPWHYATHSNDAAYLASRRNVGRHYKTMSRQQIAALPVSEIAAPDCALFIWVTWPTLLDAFKVIELWGFTYKTCAFSWIKANNSQADFFQEELKAEMKLGYWTRSNSEVCLLATRGRPKRLNADVRQGIVAPSREHSRKPDCVHERIERLVAGPYLEMFARQRRHGWVAWGDDTDKFKPTTDWDSMWARPFGKPELVWGKK